MHAYVFLSSLAKQFSLLGSTIYLKWECGATTGITWVHFYFVVLCFKYCSFPQPAYPHLCPHSSLCLSFIPLSLPPCLPPSLPIFLILILWQHDMYKAVMKWVSFLFFFSVLAIFYLLFCFFFFRLFCMLQIKFILTSIKT